MYKMATSSKARRAFVYSAFPPPVGGVAVHSERLARLLSRSGFIVEAFEMHNRFDDSVNFPFKYYRGNRLITALKFLYHTLLRRPDIVHIHVSAGRQVIFLWMLTLIISSVCPIVVTIHSGSFPSVYCQMRSWKKWLMRRMIKSTSCIVAVSDRIRYFLNSHLNAGSHLIQVIPAYLPSCAASPRNLQPSVKRIVASGYGTPIYFWEGLVNALNLVELPYEIVFAFYNEYQQPYYQDVLNQAEESLKGKIKIYNDLSPDEFAIVMSSADVFVRPTLTDGDSIAVREALELGLTVIASNSVERPEQCFIFDSGNEHMLASLIEEAIKGTIQSDGVSVDFSSRILTLYNRLIDQN